MVRFPGPPLRRFRRRRPPGAPPPQGMPRPLLTVFLRVPAGGPAMKYRPCPQGQRALPNTQQLYIAGGAAPGPTKRGGPVGVDFSRLFVLRSFSLIFRGYSRFFDKKGVSQIWQKK